MLPVVAIVGRPNVGKSTLFNQLTRTREALVADQPGLTRDRQYGTVRHPEHPFVVIDTGGLASDAGRIGKLIADQADRAMEEADVVVLLLDARDGLTPEDELITSKVRTLNREVICVVNKTDGLDPIVATGEFHRLGLGNPVPIAAAHRRGLGALMERLAACFHSLERIGESQTLDETPRVKVGIVGRPNVGKSTLVNQLVGEERVVAHDMPGTTRDSIFVPFERGRTAYTLIDTAGVRRRARVSETAEKFSIVKTLQAIEASNVIVLMLDALEGIAEQDLRLLGHVLNAGRALVIAINKWDAADKEAQALALKDRDRRLVFVDYASVVTISAANGQGVGRLMRTVNDAWRAATRKMPTPELTRLLEQAVTQHPPPIVRGRRVNLRSAHQGGSNPPRIVLHGTQAEALPNSYQRYLTRVFREAYKLHGTPIKLELRSGENPFHGRKNKLTKRQVSKRRRLMRHVKGKR